MEQAAVHAAETGGLEIWVAFGGLFLAVISALMAGQRYYDRQLNDKVSIGEYNRRHDDTAQRLMQIYDRLDKRMRSVERWQDVANGRQGWSRDEGRPGWSRLADDKDQ